MSFGRRALAVLVLIGFGTGLACLSLEVGVRVLHLLPDRFWEPDATLGTKLIPGASGWWTQEEHEFTVPVQINTQGRRDLERPVQKAAGTSRILLLGAGTVTTADTARAVIEADARDAQAFVDRWQPRVEAMTNARQSGMLRVILGETLEQQRFFEQALAGRVDLLGRRGQSLAAAHGEVLSSRWIE